MRSDEATEQTDSRDGTRGDVWGANLKDGKPLFLGGGEDLAAEKAAAFVFLWSWSTPAPPIPFVRGESERGEFSPTGFSKSSGT